MGKTISRKIDDGILTFVFENKDGEVFSSFKINPTDVHLAERCQKISDQFMELQNSFPKDASVSDVIEYDNKVESLFNYLLGYDASETIFVKPMTPTTVLPSGDIFSVMVMEAIIEMVEPEIRKRNEKLQKGLDKYLAKYKEE